MQHVSPKYWYPSIKVHNVTSQKIKVKIREAVAPWRRGCACMVPVDETQALGWIYGMRPWSKAVRVYDTPALTRTSCRLKKESNDAKNKNQTNQNAGSFLCLGGCMDLMEVMLAKQPWPHASSWGRDLSITSHPDRLICTNFKQSVSFPNVPLLWSEFCLVLPLFLLLYLFPCFCLLVTSLNNFIFFRSYFPPIFLFTNF
jgi:hypothetical protein